MSNCYSTEATASTGGGCRNTGQAVGIAEETLMTCGVAVLVAGAHC